MTKRILFAINSLMMGGAQRVAMHMVEHWLAGGHEVTILVTYYHRGRSECAVPGRANVVYLADLVAPGRSRHIDQIRRIAALRRFLQQSAPDVALSFMTDANIAVLLSAIGLGLKVVVSERSYPPSDYLPWQYRTMRWLLYPRAHAVVMQTRKGAAWLKDHIPSARAEVVSNPVVLPLPEQEPRIEPGSIASAGNRLVLSLGRLVHLKQLDKLIDAFALVADKAPGWQLVIAGDGPEAGTLRERAERRGLAHRVVFPGQVGNPGAWFAQAQVFVLTSRYEGFPNSLLEAMAYGCAPVALDCDTGPCEMITDGENGRLLPLDAPVSDLAEAMLGLIENDTMRERLALAARAVASRYSLTTIMAQWDAILLGESPFNS